MSGVVLQRILIHACELSAFAVAVEEFRGQKAWLSIEIVARWRRWWRCHHEGVPTEISAIRYRGHRCGDIHFHVSLRCLQGRFLDQRLFQSIFSENATTRGGDGNGGNGCNGEAHILFLFDYLVNQLSTNVFTKGISRCFIAKAALEDLRKKLDTCQAPLHGVPSPIKPLTRPSASQKSVMMIARMASARP